MRQSVVLIAVLLLAGCTAREPVPRDWTPTIANEAAVMSLDKPAPPPAPKPDDAGATRTPADPTTSELQAEDDESCQEGTCRPRLFGRFRR